LSISSMFCF